MPNQDCTTYLPLDARQRQTLGRLREATSKCKSDMHKPYEDGITAHVVGFKLDNAFGDEIVSAGIVEGWQEFVVVIHKDAGRRFQFNLADLVALARRAS